MKEDRKRQVIVILTMTLILFGLFIWDAYEPPAPKQAETSSASGCFANKTCEYCSIENQCPIDRCVQLNICRSSALRMNPFDIMNTCKVSGYTCMNRAEYERKLAEAEQTN
ncbi:MAG: hypothetical protein H6619_03855 [Deltaproteobacteria bacterium]|nr:hypothetical protein [Deltaproteobacteria bacterium]